MASGQLSLRNNFRAIVTNETSVTILHFKQNEADVLLQKTKYIQYDRLEKQEKMDFKVLEDFLQTFVDGFEFRK